VHDPALPLSPVSQASKRPADNELYDRGCDLVEAAMAIRRLADDPAAGRALPALLGCMETALHELGCAAASMDETSSQSMPTNPMADRMHRGFMNLGLELADAELASTAARRLAPRSLDPANTRNHTHEATS
jgi:S-methylmethionine-dependent homocysteine/selenocysteine methylase